MVFKPASGRYDGPELEQEILDFWRDNKIFEKSLKLSSGRPLYTFNEGPPTANGRPGIHHVLARTFKDVYPRYKTMQGFHVPRKAGWDTHGLPVEHEIEKELGIFDKKLIEEKIGVADFTKRCRDSVMRYISEWETLTERMGFWVDLDEAYYTLDNNYIESVWNLLKIIWEKNLIYQDYKVVPYDPRIGATLSSHEVAQGYRETEDPSVFVRFPLQDREKTYFLVWTTTPWTLPANLALAIGSDIKYAFVEHAEDIFIVAETLVESVFEDRNYRITEVVLGSSLEGLYYDRLFKELEVTGDICRVLPADFVSTEDGTGIVHVAPAYGLEDLRLCQSHGLPIVHAVELDGCFNDSIKSVAGLFFKDADPIIINHLKEKGLLFEEKTYKHNYPFGWRTGDPLIYYAKNAWYIKTTSVRNRMVELNQTINWTPKSIRDGRFGNWLEHNVDWALSRERFWGTPLPIWTDGFGDFICIGSLQELENLCGKSLKEIDLHRPSIDQIIFTHPKNGHEYRRVPEVIDCWFDSGAMSYAQWHYPFENKVKFDDHFPVDYICEAIDQTRGWFYSLHAIATLVSDEIAYRNCVCLNHIVDGDGKKMSKSQGNIVDPYDVFDSVGADPLRWYFLARLSPEAQKRISSKIVSEVASSFVNTLWNTFSFFVLYAGLDKVDLVSNVDQAERPELDRWILALLYRTIETSTQALDNYDAKRAGEAIEHFTNQLSNWYIRRSRKRFWKSEAGIDKQSAYLTLYTCLENLDKLIAPFMPFLAEKIYQHLVRGQKNDAPISVHMSRWPTLDPNWQDDNLLDSIAVVQQVVSLGRAAREESRVRVRQPLPKLLVRLPDQQKAEATILHKEQILDELNVKEIELVANDAHLITYRLKPNLPRLGSRYGKLIPKIREALKNVDGRSFSESQAARKDCQLQIDGGEINLEPDDFFVETTSAEGYAGSEANGFLIALDTRITPELAQEGLVRELIRTVQDARKQAELEVSDRISLQITGSPDIVAATSVHREWIMTETLTEEWTKHVSENTFFIEHSLDKQNWKIQLTKI
ncbi:MAG: isoleucine--tRNA ligase [Acidiferrobacteraceae bacterium]|nr:isoleucine--tRNA ligase [Acidiferrobacteraceae bacterium]|tara:strand:- start:25921 stop:29058 length:3138 start_codon:yes stop_codon:yes gene_type:complete